MDKKKSAAEQRKHFSEAKLERIALIILFSPDLIFESQIIISWHNFYGAQLVHCTYLTEFLTIKKKVKNIQYNLIIVKNLHRPHDFYNQKNKNHYPANFWDIRVIGMHASGCLGNLTLE